MRNILITGCQRSGTTLMGLILDSHEQILTIDEDIFQKDKLSEYEKLDLIPCYKLPMEAHDFGLIRDELKASKVIWMVRDPKDVIASMVNLHIKFDRFTSYSWAICAAKFEIRGALSSLPLSVIGTLHQEIEKFEAIEQKQKWERNASEVFFTAALVWKLKHMILDQYAAQDIEYHIVRYEDLVTNPVSTLTNLMSYLELPWDQNVLNHHELHHGIAIGNTTKDRPIDPSNTQKWKQTYSEHAYGIIKKLTEQQAKYFWYTFDDYKEGK